MSTLVGSSASASGLPIWTVSKSAGCSIARTHGQTLPEHLSSETIPPLRFHRWLANFRVLEVDEIKTVRGTPRSHAFVERPIGTIRREFLDRTLFWGQGDLELKLETYQAYYNRYRRHTGLAGLTPAQRSDLLSPPTACLDSYHWRRHCNGLFQIRAAA